MFCENIGFEENHVTYEQYKRLKQRYRINNMVETEEIIEKQRMIKDDEEIENIRKACEITDECFKHKRRIWLKSGWSIGSAPDNWIYFNFFKAGDERATLTLSKGIKSFIFFSLKSI